MTSSRRPTPPANPSGHRPYGPSQLRPAPTHRHVSPQPADHISMSISRSKNLSLQSASYGPSRRHAPEKQPVPHSQAAESVGTNTFREQIGLPTANRNRI